MRGKKLVALFVVLTLGVTALSFAQRRRGGRNRGGGGGTFGVKRPTPDTFNGNFTFCRIAFRQAAEADGEVNHVVIQLTEPELFECPFIMMTEVGAAYLDEEEAKALRIYLLKGG